MKKIFVIIISCLLFIGCSCSIKDKNGYNGLNREQIPAQMWFDKYIKHSTVTDSVGHTLILHEFGSRDNIYGSYSFSIEHTPECKKCCEIYD